ncbi:MAG: hypothetical protein CL930_07100 [Deltaproteobacteria bacterium]|nr:hypothetical protein [Deltaproteobacteria bacterium]
MLASNGGVVPTRTLTVVFTDLANYTASVGRSDREGLRNLIAMHEQRVAPVVEACRGRIVKNLGDSYMALFEAATDAAQACLELVNAIPEEGGFSLRASISTGDVESIDGDAFGEAVNLAARILSKTPAGEVWMSSTTRMCMNQTEISWESVGRFSLKGIAGEVPVYRIVPADKTWLPQSLVRAVRMGKLVELQKGAQRTIMPNDPVILLQGFEPGSDELLLAIDELPVVDPANLWLQTYSIAPSDRYAWTDAGRGLVIGTQDAVDRALKGANEQAARNASTDTIILDMVTNSELDLVLAGLALPSVPMSDVVAGYTYDLLEDGRWANQADQAVLRLEVKSDEIRVEPMIPGIMISGRGIQQGEKHVLQTGDTVECPSGAHRYEAVNEGGYVGLFLADTQHRTGVGGAQIVEVGREPNHPGMTLPDRRGQRNIRWCIGPRAGRAREGGFTMDRALAGRRQAAVQFTNGRAEVLGIHKTCPTFLYRGDSMSRVQDASPLDIDDMIVVGTSVIAIRAPQT